MEVKNFKHLDIVMAVLKDSQELENYFLFLDHPQIINTLDAFEARNQLNKEHYRSSCISKELKIIKIYILLIM